MPVQIIAEYGEDTVEAALYRDQKAQVQLTVLNDVDAPVLQLRPVFTLKAVGGGSSSFTGHDCSDVGLIFREEGAEDLVEEERHRAADLLGQHTIPVRQGNPQQLLGLIDPVGHAVDRDHASPGEVVVLIQLPVGRGFHPNVGVLPDNVHPGDVHLVAHGLGIHHVGEVVIPDLAVSGTAGDVVGGAAYQHLTGAGDPEHFIILTAEGEELAGQVLLEHMAPQLRAQVVLLALFVLGDVAGVAEIAQHDGDKLGICDGVQQFHPALLQGVFLFDLQGIDPKDGFSLSVGEDQTFVASFVSAADTAAAAVQADVMPQAAGQFSLVHVSQYQLLLDVRLFDRPGAHPQAEPQDDIALGGGIVGHYIGDGLGVSVENAVILQHIVLEQILRRDDVDKALVAGPGGEEPLHLEHIVPLILYGEEVVLPDPGIPQVGGGLEVFVHGLLGGGQLRIVQQIIVVLLGDPVDIHHREAVAAIPLGYRHLVFQRGEGQLGAYAQVAGQVWQQAVLQVVAVSVPAHIGGDSLVVLCGGHLGEAGQQDMGQGIYQAVAVFIGGAEGDLLSVLAAAAHDGVQTDLGSGHQLGGFHHHHELHVLEEGVVGLMEGQVVDAGAADDAHIQRLGGVGEHADVPHTRNVGDGGQTFLAPGNDVVLHRVAAQNNEYLLAAEHDPVHGVEHIGDKIVVEGIVEQNTVLLQQLQTGGQVVVVQLKAALDLLPHKAAVGLHLGVVALLQLLEQGVVGPGCQQTGVHRGIFRPQLVSKQLGEHLPEQDIVGDAVGVVRLAGEVAGQLLAVQSIREEVDLAHNQQAEYGIEGDREQVVAIELAGEEHQCGGQGHGGIVHGFQIGAGLAEVAADIPEGTLLVLLVEELRAQVVETTAGFEDHLEDGDQDPFQQDVDQQDQGIAHKEQNIGGVHRVQQVGQGRTHILQQFAQPAQGAVQSLSQLRSGAAQESGQQFHQREEPLIDPPKEDDKQDAIYQCQHRHGELPVPNGTFQISLFIQKGQQEEGKQYQQKPYQPNDGLNHTAPPF